MEDNNRLITQLETYFRGTLEPNQVAGVEEWIMQSKENEDLARKVCRAELLSSRYGAQKNVDCEKAWRQVRRRISRSRRTRFVNYAGRVSLALTIPLLICAAIFIPRYNSLSEKKSAPVVIASAPGVTTQTTLPDGTKVWLNSDSRLTYPQVFSTDTREVTLEGEGYFAVSKVKGQRFVVKAGAIEVEALGTEFNIEAYTDQVRATLAEGRIRISYPEGSVEAVPGDSYCYDDGTISRSRVNPYSLSAWRDGRIVLDNTPLSDALRMVGNHFGVNFVIENNSLLKNSYTGTFSDHSLDMILEMFSETTKISFDKVDNDGGSATTIRVR